MLLIPFYVLLYISLHILFYSLLCSTLCSVPQSIPCSIPCFVLHSVPCSILYFILHYSAFDSILFHFPFFILFYNMSHIFFCILFNILFYVLSFVIFYIPLHIIFRVLFYVLFHVLFCALLHIAPALARTSSAGASVVRASSARPSQGRGPCVARASRRPGLELDRDVHPDGSSSAGASSAGTHRRPRSNPGRATRAGGCRPGPDSRRAGHAHPGCAHPAPTTPRMAGGRGDERASRGTVSPRAWPGGGADARAAREGG